MLPQSERLAIWTNSTQRPTTSNQLRDPPRTRLGVDNPVIPMRRGAPSQVARDRTIMLHGHRSQKLGENFVSLDPPRSGLASQNHMGETAADAAVGGVVGDSVFFRMNECTHHHQEHLPRTLTTTKNTCLEHLPRALPRTQLPEKSSEREVTPCLRTCGCRTKPLSERP